MYMLSNFLSLHHDLQNYVIAPEIMKKNGKKVNFWKVIFELTNVICIFYGVFVPSSSPYTDSSFWCFILSYSLNKLQK